jgi:hypothetical protein
MRVEVAYALAHEQLILPVDVPVNVTIEDAIAQSGITKKFPDIDEANLRVGVFGNEKKLSDTLRAGDRVEIYRALIIDPKQARKNRLANKKNKEK